MNSRMLSRMMRFTADYGSNALGDADVDANADD